MAALARGAGPGGLLALATAIVLAVHGAFVLWPEQGELRRQRIALIAQLQACHTPASAPAAAMEQVRAQLRMALDQRKFAVMEQLGGAGLLLIDIRYRGEDAVRGSLRRTSMDVSAVGSYKDPDRGAGTAGRAACCAWRRWRWIASARRTG